MPAEERAAYLDKTCGTDFELRVDVERLIENDGSTEFISPHSQLAELANCQLTVGTMVGGRFRIAQFISAGGMGEVYQAVDTRLGRLVAIKVAQANFTQRFEQEARAIAALNHPNICTLYDVGPNYLVMEFLEGSPLKGPLSLHTAIEYSAQICDALHAAHVKGIIHRDLKPANIFVTKAGVKVLDFGLAKLTRDVPGPQEETQTISLTRPGAVMGTPAYMSPEQLEGRQADARSDIYAFGCVLYELLTGDRAVIGQRPVKPAAIDRVIRKCLARNPADRWQSIAEIRPQLRRSTSNPIRKLAIVAALLVLSAFSTWMWLRIPRTPSVRSIAVLPFENAGGAPEWQYLADGMTESMINRLSRIGDLTVMSRSAVFRLDKAAPDAIEKGRKLQVDAILTGTVRHYSDHLEASFELVDCASGRHLWGQRYDQVFVDALTFEKSAVEDTATQLRAHLSEVEKQRVLRDYTENTDAYRLYLKGRYEWNKRNRKGYDQAILYFQQALEADPGYALAYSGMADAYSGENDFLPPSEIFPKAEAAAKRALQIDPDLPEAHASLGFIHVQYDWTWPEAEEEFRQAIRLNPSYPTAHSMYSRLLCILGRFAEAQVEVSKAQKLDPLSMGIANAVGFTYYLARDFARADKQFQSSLTLVSNPVTASYLALTRVASGRTTDAVSEYEGILASDPSDLDTMADLTRAYALAGRREIALRTYEHLNNAAADHPPLPTSLAGAAGALNRLDDAFSLLDRAYAEKCWYLIFLKVDPLFDPLRQDQRYRVLLRKMNLN